MEEVKTDFAMQFTDRDKTIVQAIMQRHNVNKTAAVRVALNEYGRSLGVVSLGVPPSHGSAPTTGAGGRQADGDE